MSLACINLDGARPSEVKLFVGDEGFDPEVEMRAWK